MNSDFIGKWKNFYKLNFWQKFSCSIFWKSVQHEQFTTYREKNGNFPEKNLHFPVSRKLPTIIKYERYIPSPASPWKGGIICWSLLRPGGPPNGGVWWFTKTGPIVWLSIIWLELEAGIFSSLTPEPFLLRSAPSCDGEPWRLPIVRLWKEKKWLKRRFMMIRGIRNDA